MDEANSKEKKNRKKRAHHVGRFGRLLAKLPSSCPLLYPLYLAAQLDTREDVYTSSLLPREFDGFRVAYASDIHYGALLNESRVRALAERINGFQADMVLLGGDYGENSDSAIDFFALKPRFRAQTAVLAAMGNHDRMEPDRNLPRLMAAMRADGVIPLVNDAYFVERGGKKLAFASTDDYFNGLPDPKKVARQCRDADFTVYFPHNPDALIKTFHMSGGPFYQLALCGHTHGGQVTLFGRTVRYSSESRRRFLRGWFHENGVDILVSNGVGTSGIPVRLEARPQVHLITLKCESA